MSKEANIKEWTAEIDQGFEEYNLPDYMKPGVLRWVIDGVPPGSFLTALFQNNLHYAVMKSDQTNYERLFGWVLFVHYNVPSKCHGSADVMSNWKGLRNG